MKLSRILKEVKINSIYRTGGKTIKKGGFRENSNYDPDISSLHYRAQEVQPGGLFVAIPGLFADGHDFIDQARMRVHLACRLPALFQVACHISAWENIPRKR